MDKHQKEVAALRKVVITALILTLLVFVLPLLIPGGKPAAEEEPAEETPEVFEPGDWNELKRGGTLRVLVGEEIQEMALNEYIWGVTAAEMPASFELEALKAQSVAARTYALRRIGTTNQNHPDADICGDYACCQAYITPERAAGNWGENAETYREKIRRAVVETSTEAIYYDGVLIDAVFHSSSGTMTQDAVEVWGNSRPYLQPVESPEGEEVPNYNSQVVLSAEEFKGIILAAHPEAVLEGSPTGWFGEIVRTDSGSVRTAVVGGAVLRGTELRTLCKLRSASFTVECSETEIVFDVVGYGHGVGMSQYGANAMAKDGKNYQDILCWYYTDVELRAAQIDES